MLLLTALCAGCGSSFEWFPNDSSFNNGSTPTTPTTPAGTVVATVPFPTGVLTASDIFYDRASGLFWLLAGTATAPLNTPNVLVQIAIDTSTSTAAVIKTITQTPSFAWPAEITVESNMAFDGTNFWITSHGFSGGVAVSQVYQIASTGLYLGGSYSCPATLAPPANSNGFCQGLAWDGTTQSFWSADSDLGKLANYNVVNGSVSSAKSYAGLWSGGGVTDVSFDNATGQVFVIRNGVLVVQGSSGSPLGTISFTVPGTGRGDWSGTYLWVVDNTTRTLKAVFVR